jgi:hypothetical protein
MCGMCAQSKFIITNTNTTNSRVVSKYCLSGLRTFVYKYFEQITSKLHECVQQTLSVRSRLIHGGQSRQCSTWLEIPRFSPLMDLLSQVCKPILPRGEAYGRSVIEQQRSLSLNQNSNAEVCLSSPPPITHGPQFYTQPMILNWRGRRGKASLPS